MAGIALPGAGRVWTPSCVATALTNILATTKVPLKRFRDSYQNPKEQIEPSISLSASPRWGRWHPGSPVGTPRPIAPLSLNLPTVGLRLGFLA